ncbi:MAG: hypothetical protein IJ904_04370, partial [Candidatus Methanomethylophilaceae archaeon]|nr:hypothetical protein [Candidatus Methanomethylophilaceae archaeon]
MALKSGEVMKYDVNEMAAEDSESVMGLAVLNEYYPSSGVDTSALPIVLMEYSDAEEALLAQGFISYLAENGASYVDEKGNPKLSADKPFVSLGPQTKEGHEGGIILGAAVYGDFSGSIIDDTDNLRAFIGEMKTK